MSNIDNIKSGRNLSEEQAAALELVNENELLRRDPYSKRVIENAGVVDGDKKVDLGNFLAARLAFIEGQEAEGRIATLRTRDPEAVMAATSVRPDMESK